jgi:hypothetical protein
VAALAAAACRTAAWAGWAASKLTVDGFCESGRPFGAGLFFVRRAVGGQSSPKRNLTMATSARMPSRQVIFLPSR